MDSREKLQALADWYSQKYNIETPIVQYFDSQQSQLNSKSGRRSTLLGQFFPVANLIVINDGLTWEQQSDTLRHELAHAIVYHQEGIGGHGRRWRRIARQLGTNPRANQSHNPLFNNS